MSTAAILDTLAKRKLTSLDAACELLATSYDLRQMTVSGVGWAGYQRVLQARQDASRRAVWITYSLGEIELVTLGSIHERWKHVLSTLLAVYLEEMQIPAVCCGGMTIAKEDLDRGFEPDECYYLSNSHRVLAMRQLDFASDPPPDLAIEIEVTRKMIDKLPIYAAFKVSEVWRFDGSTLTVLALKSDGTYETVPTSRVLPTIPMEDLIRFSQLARTIDDSALSRQFREFVRTLPSAS